MIQARPLLLAALLLASPAVAQEPARPQSPEQIETCLRDVSCASRWLCCAATYAFSGRAKVRERPLRGDMLKLEIATWRPVIERRAGRQ